MEQFAPLNPEVQPAVGAFAPIDEEQTRTIPTPEVTADRARRLEFSFGEMLGKSYNDLISEIGRGSEKEIREEAAAKVDAAKKKFREAQIADLARQRGRALNLDEVQVLLDPERPENRPTSPETVAEDVFANKYVKALEDASLAMGGTFLDDAKENDPVATAQMLRATSKTIAKSNYLLQQVEDLEQFTANQSWAPWIADRTKEIFPGYVEYKQRGQIKKGNALEGFLLGTNLQAQSRRLWAINDLDEFKEEFKRVIEPLKQDNPGLARDFAKAMWGQDQGQMVLNNIFTPLEALGIGDIGIAAKAGYNALRGRRQVAEAAKKLANSNTTPEELNVKINEATGNIDEAAVQRAKNGFQTSNDPIKEALDSVSTYYRVDKNALEADTGNLSAALATRVRDAISRTDNNLRTVLSEMLRVNRIPWATMSEDAIRTVKEVVRNNLPGHRVADIGNPVHNPITNNHYVDIKVVGPDDKLFPTKEQAQKYMEQTGVAGKLESQAYEPVVVDNSLTVKDRARKAKLQTELDAAKKELPIQMRNAENSGLSATDRAAARKNADKLNALIKNHAKSITRLDKKLTDELVSTYYIPEAAAKAFDGLKVTDSVPTFYTDMKNNVSVVHTTTPTSGYIPVNVSADGLFVKFMPRVPEIAVEQQGLGWYIRMTKTIDERDPAILSLVRQSAEARSTADETGFMPWVRAATNWARTGADTMSRFELESRNNATYTKSLLIALLKEDMKYVKDVARGVTRTDPITGEAIWLPRLKSLNPFSMISSRERYNQFKTALEQANKAVDPKTKETGYFFKTLGELDEFYTQTFHRSPSYEETQGYFAAVRAMETDRVLRNMALYRNKARLGAEGQTFHFFGPDGTKVSSEKIDGIVRGRIPGGDDDAIFIDSKTGKTKEYRLNSPLPKDIRDRIEKGELKAVELYDVYSRPLSGFGDIGDRIYRYVITDGVETTPLSFQQVNRRGGFHFDYDYGYYLKQARVTAQRVGNSVRNTYEGDMTAFALMNRQMGDDFAKHFNAARELLKAGRRKEARDYVNNNFPGIKFDDFASDFRPKKSPDGKLLPARWSLDEPFHVVPRGKSIKEIDSSFDGRWSTRGGVKDGTKSGSLARQFEVEYTGQRDAVGLEAITDIGSARNPIYNVGPADFVDPLDTLNRGLNRIVNSTFMDDYKITAVTQWLEEAAPFLNVPGGINEIRSAPFWYFKNAEFKRGPETEATFNMAQNRKKIRDFVGQPDWYETWAHRGTEILSNAMYRNFGPGKEIAPLWLVDRIADAPAIMRSFAVHAKLGLFALPQLIVQNMTWVNMAAVAGIGNAGHGAAATLMHQWSRINRNPTFLEELSRKMENFGWKPGEWLEANKAMMKTGFGNVGGEFADLNNAFKHTFIGNNAKDFLDLGQVVWKEAERNVRYGAWYIAYKEFRKQKPTGALTQADLTDVLARADLLSGNMSRAHNSILQSGPFSLTTQFLSYQIRLAELFLGKRLGNTVQERMLARGRLIAWNAGMYGIPVATGVVGMPTSELIRKTAAENGYNVGENYASSMLMEGIPAVLLAMITGDGDMREGNMYNFGNRYGSPGFTQLRELLSSDKPWWQAVGGASFNIMANTWANTDGFYRASLSLITGDQTDEKFALKVEDFVDIFKELTMVNNSWRALIAANTGKWLSRNENYIGDASAANAIFMSATGLNLMDADESFTLNSMKKARDGLQKEVFNKAIKEWRRGLRAMDSGDIDQATQYQRRMLGYLKAGDYPEEKFWEVIQIGNKDHETQIQRAKWDYFMRNVPRGREESSQQTMIDWMELRRKKEQ